MKGAINGLVLNNGSASTLIGGNVEEAGNLISGYTNGAGIIVRQGSDNAVIAGNLIGTDLTSAYVIGNQVGILVDGYSGVAGMNVDNARIGTDGDGIGDALEGNTIAGAVIGIYVTDAAPDQQALNTRIAGNRIGTAGALDLGNTSYGIYTNASSVTIGGPSEVFGNESPSIEQGLGLVRGVKVYRFGATASSATISWELISVLME